MSLDGFDALTAHLATVHPSKYIKLIDGIDFIALTGVHELTDQNAALRLVAFIDRVYDAEIPIVASGTPHSRRAARATRAVSEVAVVPVVATAVDDMACCPSPNRVCRTVWPTASRATMPGSERVRPASGAAHTRTPTKPAPRVHSGTEAQEANV